jgi:hypothetical protein
MPIIWIRRRKIQSWSSWILVLLIGFGYLESARAGSASDAFADSLDPTSGQNPNLLAGIGDYFTDWFKRVDEIRQCDRILWCQCLPSHRC